MNIKEAPSKGHVYAQTRGGEIVFDEYNLQGDVVKLKKGKELSFDACTEVHLFDEGSEFRVVSVNGEQKCMVLTAEQEKDNEEMVTYTENQFLMDEFCEGGAQQKLVVVSRFAYGENDSLYLCDYRLAGVIE